MPERIQLKRTKGWRIPDNTVKVDRSNKKWGNPYRVLQVKTGEWEVYLCLDGALSGPTVGIYPTKMIALAVAVRLHRERIMGPEGDLLRQLARRELRGKNLGCWCGHGQPCHGDNWLEVANA